MAARLSVLYVLFEGLPETVIDSQVGEHIRFVRERLQWDFEICAVACNAPSHAGALRRKQAVEAHTGCRVRVLRGMRPALPGSRLVNGHRVAQAIGLSLVSFDLIHARND